MANVAQGTQQVILALQELFDDPTNLTLANLDHAVTILEYTEHNNTVYWNKFFKYARELLARFQQSTTWEEFIIKLRQIYGPAANYAESTKSTRRLSLPSPKPCPPWSPEVYHSRLVELYTKMGWDTLPKELQPEEEEPEEITEEEELESINIMNDGPGITKADLSGEETEEEKKPYVVGVGKLGELIWSPADKEPATEGESPKPPSSYPGFADYFKAESSTKPQPILGDLIDTDSAPATSYFSKQTLAAAEEAVANSKKAKRKKKSNTPA